MRRMTSRDLHNSVDLTMTPVVIQVINSDVTLITLSE